MSNFFVLSISSYDRNFEDLRCNEIALKLDDNNLLENALDISISSDDPLFDSIIGSKNYTDYIKEISNQSKGKDIKSFTTYVVNNFFDGRIDNINVKSIDSAEYSEHAINIKKAIENIENGSNHYLISFLDFDTSSDIGNTFAMKTNKAGKIEDVIDIDAKPYNSLTYKSNFSNTQKTPEANCEEYINNISLSYKNKNLKDLLIDISNRFHGSFDKIKEKIRIKKISKDNWTEFSENRKTLLFNLKKTQNKASLEMEKMLTKSLQEFFDHHK